ncbi:MAG: class I SAM-dependent methyltransferase, partial [Vallitaleaceae bacterium]|nr:class I SAM-dependent methyltransferase [Vallitaleaceae bacterium]
MYKLFAKYYDELMEQVPYNEWAAYMDFLIREHGVREQPSTGHKLLVELGCGTGNMSIQMARFGYDVIGVDNSDEMLSIAKGKEEPIGINDASVSPILYINQDMR